MKFINNKAIISNKNVFLLGNQDKENSCSPCIGISSNSYPDRLGCVYEINKMLGVESRVCYAATSMPDYRLRIISYPYKISIFMNSYIKSLFHKGN